MNEGLGKRLYREYCWFAVILLALLLCFANRAPSTSEAGNRSAAPAAAANR
jgi:uncharacterized membrane protein